MSKTYQNEMKMDFIWKLTPNGVLPNGGQDFNI